MAAPKKNQLIYMQRGVDEILKKKISRFSFDVGILEDGPHYKPVWDSEKTFAGGPARRQSKKLSSAHSLSILSLNIRTMLGVNYLSEPFKKRSSEIIKFTNAFFKLAFATTPGTYKRRCENLIQAVVRNPILLGAYGRNSRAWARAKGFNRKLIDTGQFFKAIKGRVNTVGGSSV